MLILGRKEGQEIWVDNGRIRILVVEAARGKARIAITAPDDVIIDRKEVAQRRAQWSEPVTTNQPEPEAA